MGGRGERKTRDRGERMWGRIWIRLWSHGLHPKNLRAGVWTPHPSACDEVILTRQDLEDGREEEASALDQPEELVEEGDEGEEAEEDGEDHQGLNRLDPVCRDTQGKMESLTESLTKRITSSFARLRGCRRTFVAGRPAVVASISRHAFVPQICAAVPTYSPRLETQQHRDNFKNTQQHPASLSWGLNNPTAHHSHYLFLFVQISTVQRLQCDLRSPPWTRWAGWGWWGAARARRAGWAAFFQVDLEEDTIKYLGKKSKNQKINPHEPWTVSLWGVELGVTAAGR